MATEVPQELHAAIRICDRLSIAGECLVAAAHLGFGAIEQHSERVPICSDEDTPVFICGKGSGRQHSERESLHWRMWIYACKRHAEADRVIVNQIAIVIFVS